MSGPSGAHRSPRVLLSAPADQLGRWRAKAKREGVTLAEWIRKACRAYERMDRHGGLTHEDWEYIAKDA